MGGNRRLAVITGGSAGLGTVFARRLAEQGYDLMLAARRQDRLQALKIEIEAAHQISVATFAGDLSEPSRLKRFAEDLEGCDRVDLLINNAGYGTLGVFWETDYEQQEAMHRLHVGATMRLTRAVLPGMVARKSGAIINVASVAGFFRSAGNASYCATKGWMCDFTEALRLELDDAGSPVVVQALCPGFTYTEFHDVMGVDRGAISRKWWMPAEFVVEESLKALGTGDLFVVPGWRYKLLVALGSRLPVGWRLAVERMSMHRRHRKGK
jgi:hypothetical protein